ncbi:MULTISPECIES: MFS transporter [unclassified Leucobacter]|uniref:MFS transporter n=1 Tax=unclassified Leucobacter TaxID=2621730 RepID=UPI00165E2630|nr:MFS transporter [Leucobacter sp. CX169]MBC9926557.1 MFS transporter [Leucobacter sp. cx-169]MBC9937158.1 MFS transporter [Leucobacter sp. cx-87]
MGIYRELAKSPGVFRIIAAQLTARFPFGMLSIAMLLHIELTYGNYTAAGIVLAAESIGQAISGPVTSRLMGRWGMRPVLGVTSLVCSAMIAIIALMHMPIWAIAIIAFFLGITTPPVTPAVRTIYPKMVPSRQLSALFSLDASAQEIIWIIGPVVAVFVSTQISTTVGLLVAMSFMLLGGFWFIASPEVGRVRIPLSRRRLGAVLSRPTVIVATIVGFLFVASFAAVEAGIVSVFGHEGIDSGIVLAIFSAGSIVGGLLIGGRQITPWSLFWRILIVAGGTLLCLFSLDMWWLSLVLFFAGFGVAPSLAAIFTIVSSTVKFSETAEAFGWVGTGQLIGVALGSAFAGFAIDRFGPMGAISASAAFLVLAAIAAAISSRWIPDMRGRDAAPIPDTAPITLPQV